MVFAAAIETSGFCEGDDSFWIVINFVLRWCGRTMRML